MNVFSQLGIDDALVRAITEMGFEQPTPVQTQVIPVLNSPETGDVIALAQTGTGKTATFGLPLLQKIRTEQRVLQAVILCPTRELCVQVAKDLENFSRFLPYCRVSAVYGGASMIKQIREIQNGAQIVVATPGRFIDLLDRGILDMSSVTRFVLDEADEMLNMGFQEAIDRILGTVPTKESVWLFSATMPAEVRRIAERYMNKPKEMVIGNRNEGGKNIEHHYYLCKSDDRYSVLKRIVDYYPGIFGLIFCRTKAETQDIADQMGRDGYNSAPLHGDMSQRDRDRTMQLFREGTLQLLIATDVAARGIDVSGITHVINYALPDELEIYTHRSGRTARAGKSGISISILSQREIQKLQRIERLSRATFQQRPIPLGKEVCEQQLMHIIHSINSSEVQSADIEPFMPMIYEELKDLTKEDLIHKLVSVEFTRFLTYYKDAVDLNPGSRGDKKKRTDMRDAVGGGASGQARLFINVGDMDGMDKRDMLKLIRSVGVPAAAIGRIDLGRSFSFFEVDRSVVPSLLREMNNLMIDNRDIRVDEAGESQRHNDKKKPSGKKPFEHIHRKN